MKGIIRNAARVAVTATMLIAVVAFLWVLAPRQTFPTSDAVELAAIMVAISPAVAVAIVKAVQWAD